MEEPFAAVILLKQYLDDSYTEDPKAQVAVVVEASAGPGNWTAVDNLTAFEAVDLANLPAGTAFGGVAAVPWTQPLDHNVDHSWKSNQDC